MRTRLVRIRYCFPIHPIFQSKANTHRVFGVRFVQYYSFYFPIRRICLLFFRFWDMSHEKLLVTVAIYNSVLAG